MVLQHWRKLNLGILCLLLATPAYAVPIPDAAIHPDVEAHYAIQIIEGDKVTMISPPVPKLHGGVSMIEAASSAGSSEEIGAMIRLFNRNLTPTQVSEISRAIHLYGGSYNLDPRLIASLVAVESSFNPMAISRTGAIGLGQLKPATAQWLGVGDPYNPVENLSGVAKYLRYLLDRYNGSVQHALAAYFQGQGTIDRMGINANAQYYIGKVNQVFGRFF